MTRLVNRLTQLSGALFYFLTFRREKNGAVLPSGRPSQTDESIDSVELSRLGYLSVKSEMISFC